MSGLAYGEQLAGVDSELQFDVFLEENVWFRLIIALVVVQ